MPIFCLYLHGHPSILSLPTQAHRYFVLTYTNTQAFCLDLHKHTSILSLPTQTHQYFAFTNISTPVFCLYRHKHNNILSVPTQTPYYFVFTYTITPVFCLNLYKIPCFYFTYTSTPVFCLYLVMVEHSFKHGCFPIEIQYLTTALGRILFSSVVMVLAYQSGGPGSNPARIIYFCHAFIHFFLCYELCS